MVETDQYFHVIDDVMLAFLQLKSQLFSLSWSQGIVSFRLSWNSLLIIFLYLPRLLTSCLILLSPAKPPVYINVHGKSTNKWIHIHIPCIDRNGSYYSWWSRLINEVTGERDDLLWCYIYTHYTHTMKFDSVLGLYLFIKGFINTFIKYLYLFMREGENSS